MRRFIPGQNQHQRVRRRLSAYLDGELPEDQQHEIHLHLQGCPDCRGALDGIRHAATLTKATEVLSVPPSVWTDVEQAVRKERARPSRAIGSARILGVQVIQFWRRHPVPAFLSVAVLALVLAQRLPPDTTLSAEGVLQLSDRALAQVVKPGEIFYRRWHQSRRAHPKDGVPTVHNEVMHSWIDGSNLRRTAGRLTSADGDFLAASTETGNPEDAPLTYFGPAYTGVFRNVVVIPIREAELRAAIERYSPEDQELLRQYFGPAYGPPLTGEMAYNRQLIQGPSPSGTVLPRVQRSMEFTKLRGEPVAVIRTMHPVRPWSEYGADGAISTALARVDTVRWISRKTYLTLRIETTATLEDQRQVSYASDLLEMRSIPAADLDSEPFHLEIPPGTPIKRYQPDDQLLSLVAALRRIARDSTDPAPAAGMD